MSEQRLVELPDGTLRVAPAELARVIEGALKASQRHMESAEAWVTAFIEELLAALHREGFILVPRDRSKSRVTVDADLYSLALSWADDARARNRRAREIFNGDACRGDLHGEFHAAVLSLTGHAPLPGVGRVAGVDERLRQLRELLLHIPLDQEAIEPPKPVTFDVPTEEPSDG